MYLPNIGAGGRPWRHLKSRCHCDVGERRVKRGRADAADVAEWKARWRGSSGGIGSASVKPGKACSGGNAAARHGVSNGSIMA